MVVGTDMTYYERELLSSLIKHELRNITHQLSIYEGYSGMYNFRVELSRYKVIRVYLSIKDDVFNEREIERLRFEIAQYQLELL